MLGTRRYCFAGGAIAVMLGIGLAACSPVTRYVERAVERELQEAVGPADSYRVSISGLRTSSGEADVVSVVGVRVRPEGAPTVHRLEMQLRGVRFDRASRQLERVEEASAIAFLTQQDVADYLEAHRNLADVSVDLQPPQRATIRARPEIGGIQLPRNVFVNVAGDVTADEGVARFDVTELRAAGFDLGANASRRLTEVINPLLDLRQVPADLRVTSVYVRDTLLVAEATGVLTRE